MKLSLASMTTLVWAVALAGFVALPGARGALRGGKQLTLRSTLRANSTNCPGIGGPCSNNGECDEQKGVCLCKLGWGSTDCATEIAESYDITSVASRDMEDMLGTFIRVPMYLQETAGDPEAVKFIHYDPISTGWAISKLNSSCTDDICFFAHANYQPVPPPKGYVFGEPDKHVYYRQLVFDDSDLYPGKMPGYHMAVSYTPDPDAVGVSEALSEFTGRYIIQPRYVHQKTGKYAIMPVSLGAPGKLWVLLGLAGVGPSRRWKILAQSKDPSFNRYTAPAGGWSPPSMGFKLVPSCPNHLSDDACNALEDQCRGDGPDVKWVQQCCRNTCNTCPIESTACSLPETDKLAAKARLAASLLQGFGNRTFN